MHSGWPLQQTKGVAARKCLQLPQACNATPCNACLSLLRLQTPDATHATSLGVPKQARRPHLSAVLAGTMRLGQATVTYDTEAEPCEELPWEHITGDATAPHAPASGCCVTRKVFSAISCSVDFGAWP